MKYRLLRTREFRDWIEALTKKEQQQILKRLSHIESDGHFGVCKELGKGLWELKWANGRRIYYSFDGRTVVLILIGGNKNGQDQDIRKAQKLLQNYFQQARNGKKD